MSQASQPPFTVATPCDKTRLPFFAPSECCAKLYTFGPENRGLQSRRHVVPALPRIRGHRGCNCVLPSALRALKTTADPGGLDCLRER